jgi:benzoylformate decarboxylase
MAALAAALPDDGIVVNESPSNTLVLRDQLRLSRPGSYFFCQGGGLGWGLAAAVGVQMAQPDRPVVGVIGDGSMQYAIAALWSAAAYRVPITVLVPRNDEYAILKWFSQLEDVSGSPGLDVPGLDTVAIAKGYGVRARRVDGRDELQSALREAIDSDAPEVIEVPIERGMNT